MQSSRCYYDTRHACLHGCGCSSLRVGSTNQATCCGQLDPHACTKDVGTLVKNRVYSRTRNGPSQSIRPTILLFSVCVCVCVYARPLAHVLQTQIHVKWCAANINSTQNLFECTHTHNVLTAYEKGGGVNANTVSLISLGAQ